MKNDEYNKVKITNEDTNPSFEFGNTQDAEFTSYHDNINKVRDEVNDNPASNYTNKKAERKQREKQENTSKGNASNSGSSPKGGPETSISSATSTVATVAGASLVSVATISTLVGINVYFNGKCNMNWIEPTPYSIAYQLDLTDINNDECSITLSNAEYTVTQALNPSINSGEFGDLIPATEYKLSVIDITYNNYLLYEESVFTTHEEPIPVNTYIVSFISNGGSEVDTQTVDENSCASKPADPTRDGYSFVGWFKDNSLTEEFDFATPITRDTALFAKWEKLIIYNTVSFDANGATGEMENVKVAEGNTFIVPECGFEAEKGKVFDYWTSNLEADRHYNPGDEIALSSDAILTANWTTKICTISFVANNGTEETKEPIELEYNTEFSLPDCEFSDPSEREMFAGWMIGSTGPVNHYTWNVKNDVVLTASWKECYIVTYYNNVEPIETIEVKIPTDRSIYDTLDHCDFKAPEGYYFYAWLDGDNQITPGGYVTIEGDKRLLAYWVPEDGYHVSFDSDGGEGDMSEYEADIKINETFTLPECFFEAPDYTKKFSSWSYNGYYYNPGQEVTITEETIFTAVWGENDTYTVSLGPGDGTGNIISETVYDGQDYELPSELPAGFTAPDRMIFAGWTDGENTYDMGEEVTIDGSNLSFAAYYESAEPVFNSVTFNAFDEDNDKMYVTLDYYDPLGYWSSMSIAFDEELIVGIEPTTMTQDIAIDTSLLDFDSNNIHSFEVRCYDDEEVEHVLTSGTINFTQFSTSGSRAKVSVLDAGSTSRAYWNGSGYSSTAAVKVAYNEFESDKDYYLRYIIYGNTAYRYSNALLKTDGVQIVSFDKGYSGNYINLTTFELVSSSDGGATYEVVKDLGTTSLNDINNNTNLQSYLFGGYFDNDTLPVSTSEAENFKLNLAGRNLSGLNDYLTVTLSINFLTGSDTGNLGNDYSIDVVLRTADLSAGYATIDLTKIKSAAFGDESGYEGFISKARRYAANVSMTYYSETLGGNQTINLYSSHLFKCA